MRKFFKQEWELRNLKHGYIVSLCNACVLLGFVTLSAPVSAQSTIALRKDEIVIHPVITKENKQEVQQIKMTIDLSGPGPTDKRDIVLTIKLETPRTPSVEPRLRDDKITIKASDWQKEGKEKDTSLQRDVILETNSVSAFTTDELFYLSLANDSLKNSTKLKSGSENNIQVRVTTIGAFNPNKSFWMEVGANFDLIDGLQANNFFAGVFFYSRDIRPVFYRSQSKVNSLKKKDTTTAKWQNYQREKNLAVFAGVFESKTLTTKTEENFTQRKYYDSTSIIPGNPDTLKVYTGIGNRVSLRTVKNVGLFFSPQVRLTNGSANEDGLHLFASLWMELQWQRIREEITFNQISNVKTERKPTDSVITNPAYNTRIDVKETDVRSHYFGIGLPVFYREKTGDDLVQLFLNPVIGFTNQPNKQYLQDKATYDFLRIKNPGLAEPVLKWKPFYVIQFRLNEESYGIAFTGEVRGLLARNNAPFVSLSLTKKFDLTKFIEYSKK